MPPIDPPIPNEAILECTQMVYGAVPCLSVWFIPAEQMSATAPRAVAHRGMNFVKCSRCQASYAFNFTTGTWVANPGINLDNFEEFVDPASRVPRS